jgi:hypothetical protein
MARCEFCFYTGSGDKVKAWMSGGIVWIAGVSRSGDLEVTLHIGRLEAKQIVEKLTAFVAAEEAKEVADDASTVQPS